MMTKGKSTHLVEITMATRVRWLGHACLLVESDGKNLLIDPFLTGNPKAAAKASEVPADFILISHGHGDHVGDAIAIAERTGATVIANYEISEWLGKQGLTRVHSIRGGGFAFPFGRVKMTITSAPRPTAQWRHPPATCSSGRLPHLRRRHRPVRRHALIGEGIDLAILPIGDNTIGPTAPSAANTLPKVMPIHFDTFRRSCRTRRLGRRVKQQGVAASRCSNRSGQR